MWQDFKEDQGKLKEGLKAFKKGNLNTQQEAEFLACQAKWIYNNWKGKKKLLHNFWKPFFGGQKLSKQQVKNLKRLVRRSLFEMFIVSKSDRLTIENMSDSVFMVKLLKLEEKKYYNFLGELENIQEFLINLGKKYDIFNNAQKHKKLYMAYEIYAIKQNLKSLFQKQTCKKKIRKPSRNINADQFIELNSNEQQQENLFHQFLDEEQNYDMLIFNSEKKSESDVEENQKQDEILYEQSFIQLGSADKTEEVQGVSIRSSILLEQGI